MKKKIEDYLHLYLGCEVQTDEGKGYLTGIHGEYGAEVQLIIDGNASESPCYPQGVKSILRSLSDMTEDEMIYIDDEFSYGYVLSNLSKSLKAGSLYQMKIGETFEITRYLLSKGFDLFGLIEAGLAIDKTKI